MGAEETNANEVPLHVDFEVHNVLTKFGLMLELRLYDFIVKTFFIVRDLNVYDLLHIYFACPILGDYSVSFCVEQKIFHVQIHHYIGRQILVLVLNLDVA